MIARRKPYKKPELKVYERADPRRILGGIDNFSIRRHGIGHKVIFGNYGSCKFYEIYSSRYKDKYGRGVDVTDVEITEPRQKLGTFMMKKLFEELRQREYKYVILKSESTALEFYESLGFVVNPFYNDRLSLIKFL